MAGLKSKPKLKTCKAKGCRNKFVPSRPFEDWCSFDCAVKLSQARQEAARKRKEAKDRREVKARLLELKPIQYWLKRAEKACNAYIRERDADEPCISCGTWDAMEWHSGHFIPVGRAKSIRFEEDNIHKQCDQCNRHFNGNATKYEISLLHKIGLINTERLKTAPKEKKWTREECQKIEAKYKSKLKVLKNAK